ncbi:palmitoyltransferase ZDHHC16A-like isoform X2 [Dreissena polymorpha]|uniref:palmitoyltransferase ZDHHC16A-like isoform X2 n=1 Tax=Dreissena polymorpha TaxID=45954 RepID=UPI002263FAD1|nr:palmitoyltransferase ZDHHC16A-like isoform X2 [Dreissena polymorpha]
MIHTANPALSYLTVMMCVGRACAWLPRKIRRRVRECSEWMTTLYYTLYFNYFTTFFLALEVMMEPLFWFVEKFARFLGPMFVTLVTVMTTSVVTIFYVCLLPHVYDISLGLTVFHLIFGHWLLANIVFHYVMAAFTQPGTPPPQNVPEIVSVCKKCISPKPPRTHHCTICGKCILKMDHHCPWLNNCVGHRNHRYFFLFCLYMWMGTIYVSWVGHELFRQHFYGDKPTRFPPFLYPLNAIHDAIYNPKIYTNPFHYGLKKNWMVFLGFSNFSSFVRRVLLPSTHEPEGSGLTWERASYKFHPDKGLQRVSNGTPTS